VSFSPPQLCAWRPTRRDRRRDPTTWVQAKGRGARSGEGREGACFDSRCLSVRSRARASAERPARTAAARAARRAPDLNVVALGKNADDDAVGLDDGRGAAASVGELRRRQAERLVGREDDERVLVGVEQRRDLGEVWHRLREPARRVLQRERHHARSGLAGSRPAESWARATAQPARRCEGLHIRTPQRDAACCCQSDRRPFRHCARSLRGL
jgi:hypothetical protein